MKIKTKEKERSYLDFLETGKELWELGLSRDDLSRRNSKSKE